MPLEDSHKETNGPKERVSESYEYYSYFAPFTVTGLHRSSAVLCWVTFMRYSFTFSLCYQTKFPPKLLGFFPAEK